MEDAAKHLSSVFDEVVTEADVLLALDRRLRLSINLVNGSYGSSCIPVNLDDVECEEFPGLDLNTSIRIPKGGKIF